LAQKLAIRLGKHFPRSKLVEIQAHTLGSKFFSESGKLVSKMFEGIEAMLVEEEDTFVCVFIDEVETITARREQAITGNEPLDAMRAVNTLLTALDRLRHHMNIIILCTSNLISALVSDYGSNVEFVVSIRRVNKFHIQDSAFIDRIDIKQFIPHPNATIIYEIYKSCFENLNKCGVIEGLTFDVIQLNPQDPETPLQYIENPADRLILPTYDEMLIGYQIFPDSIPKQLADVASASVVCASAAH
jgi:pachytene checkpoint protein 2